MRFPNSYGSVIRLSGKRRKPYAVRITTGYELRGEAGHERLTQKYKYLEYFEKRKDAVIYLANYNSGMRVKEHESLQDALTFAQVYDKWIEERENSKKGLSHQLRNSYNAAFQKFAAIHKKKIRSVRLADVQPIFAENVTMSKGTVSNMRTVVRGIYRYAMRYDLVDSDFTSLLIIDAADPRPIHKPFTDAEISTLWEHADDEIAQFVLVTIYTGMRPIELLSMPSSAVDIDARIMRGGVKTAAGRDRVIPIHKKIVPILRKRTEHAYLFYDGKKPTSTFIGVYKSYMVTLGMSHLPHDGRHTCATLMERAGVPINRRKRILGHSIDDITEGVYTHVDPAQLVAEIDKI